jgi:hypothetical protein
MDAFCFARAAAIPSGPTLNWDENKSCPDMQKSRNIWLDPFAATWVFLFRREIDTRCVRWAWGIWRLSTPRAARLATAAGRPIRRMAGRRGFALLCLATDGLTLLSMADPLRP